MDSPHDVGALSRVLFRHFWFSVCLYFTAARVSNGTVFSTVCLGSSGICPIQLFFPCPSLEPSGAFPIPISHAYPGGFRYRHLWSQFSDRHDKLRNCCVDTALDTPFSTSQIKFYSTHFKAGKRCRCVNGSHIVELNLVVWTYDRIQAHRR